MKPRNTLFLLFLAVAAGAFLYFFDAKWTTSRDAQRDAKRVVDLDRDTINAITIKNAEGIIELRKQENDVWFLEKPVKDRVNSLVISGLFTTAESLKFDAVIGDDRDVKKEQLREFGLTDSGTKVTFSGGPKTVELLFGKDTAVEGKLYVKLADQKRVFVIPNALKTEISKKADEFRDRKLTNLTVAEVSKVAVKTSGGEIELARKNDHWSIVKPLAARGDDARVGDLISQATTATIDSFVADTTNLAAYGLQEPRGTVSLYSEGNAQPTVLQIGANPQEEKDKEKTYAKLSSRDSVVVLPKTIESLLALQPNELRDKNLMRFEPDIVDRINIEAPGQEKVVIARQGESWVRKAGEKDLPVNVALATRLLTDLQSQQVAGFVADVATELSKYGLEAPLIRVTLSSYASDNTAETKKGEKEIQTVLFGQAEGENLYAKLDDEPFVVSVPKTILESIPVEPIAWQELAIFKFKPEEIVALEVTRAQQPAISAVREKEQWKLASGDGNLNQIHAQSLVNTLASLRAVRWSGPSKPADGLATPTVVVSFQTASGASGKITVGAAAEDQTWSATADGLPGTFVLSRPDEEALVLPLLDKPAPAPPPEPPAPAVSTPPAPEAPPARIPE